VIREGSKTARLGEPDVRSVLARWWAAHPLDGKRVLVVIPDHTRSGPTGTFFRAISDALMPVTRKLGFLIALGTHPALPEDKICQLCCT